MVKIRRYVALLLCLCLSTALCACGEDDDAIYIKVETLSEEQFCIAFRQGDRLCDTVTAALEVLAADGTVADISRRWFGRDVTLISGNADALSQLGYEIGPRTFIMGLDNGCTPMSFRESGAYTGFDVELALAVCDTLGWELRFQDIDQNNAAVELAAGNVDAAWGGMSFAQSGNYSLSPAYMNNEKIIVTLSESGFKRLSHLRNKDLGSRDSSEYLSLLDGDGNLRANFSTIQILFGTDRLFDALSSGICDAILTDSAALDYYAFMNG